MPDKAKPEGHNGYIWPRASTQYGANLAGKSEMVLLKSSIKGAP